jgi:hypothetical protein
LLDLLCDFGIRQGARRASTLPHNYRTPPAIGSHPDLVLIVHIDSSLPQVTADCIGFIKVLGSARLLTLVDKLMDLVVLRAWRGTELSIVRSRPF